MGQVSSLSFQDKEKYRNEYDESCRKAAVAISQADIMLFAHGAGMSADSGLAVFNDIAKFEAYKKRGLTYPDICVPGWLDDESDLFYGFWGKCYNDYMKTAPNNGYFIVKNWREKLFNGQKTTKNEEWIDKLNESFIRRMKEHYVHRENFEEIAPFFIYTSNIDSHSMKPGLFVEHEVYEIHGSTEKWQCSDCCTLKKWDLPANYTFEINMNTMKSNPTDLAPCPDCGKPSRPWVLMFGDMMWNGAAYMRHRYSSWRESIVEIANEYDLKVVVLEVGAGTNVPTVRLQSESVVRDIKTGNCKLIRINPDFPHSGDALVENHVVGIMEKGLPALTKINEYFEELTSQ